MKKIKNLILTLCLTFSFYNLALAQETEVDSKIIQSIVYPQDTLITRLATLKLSPGEQKIIFPNIIPELDENSLRISGTGNAEVKILGVSLKREFLEEVPQEKVKQLKEEIQKLQDEIRRLQDIKKVLGDEKQFLDSIRLFSNGQIPKELVTKMPSAQELENTLKFLDTKLRDNYEQIIDTELEIRELYKKIDVLNRQLGQISGPDRKLKRSIIVELEVLKAGNFDLSVAYLVKGASWQPLYDARASFEKSAVELISQGIITQTTGEDWQDVEIYLSTAKPRLGGRMPYVAPWFIRPYQPPAPIYEKGVARFKSDAAYQTMAFEKEKMLPAQAIPEEINKYAIAEEKGIAVIYKLARRATVKSDGTEHKLPVSSQILKADFEYSSYPRLAPYAYLGSRVTNAKELQLLAGRVNIFLEGDFVGVSSIDNIGPGEEFDLYLGVDENVKVKREQIEKKVDETLVAGIPAPTKKTTYKYKLSVENYKSRLVNVKLFEAIPVSEDDRIKVKVTGVSPEPKEKDWKDRKGIWLWELGLEPKQKQEIFYTFIVEHPRDMRVEGL